jgi:hypothetical protein
VRWLLPLPLRAPWRWTPLDDPDAYDPRDPAIFDAFIRAAQR